MSTSIHQKVILITGASSGIGEALAHEFSDHGAHLVLFARRKDRLHQLQKELASRGTRVLVVTGDVTQEDDLNQAVKQACQEFSRLDGVIANAGFGVGGKAERLGVSDYQRQFDTNVFGVVRTFYASIAELKKTRGFFAIMGSVNGHIALPTTSAYGMSKFAVRAFADSLYYEMLPHQVSVIHISPGYVDSEIRRVDNQGVFQEQRKDPTPKWLQMKTQTAARQMVRGIRNGKRQITITPMGKVLLVIERYFPSMIRAVLSRSMFRSRNLTQRGD